MKRTRDAAFPRRIRDDRILSTVAAARQLTFERTVGNGMYGTVHLLRDAAGRGVAAKVCLQSCDKLRDEYRILQHLADANVKGVLRPIELLAVSETQHVLLYEFVDGVLLSKWRGSDRDRMFDRLHAILAAVHGANICHHDIKAANIVVNGDDEPTLIDWGNATMGCSDEEKNAEYIPLRDAVYHGEP